MKKWGFFGLGILMSLSVLAAPPWSGTVGGKPALAVSGGSSLMTAAQIKALLLSKKSVSSVGSVSISGNSIVINNIVVKDVNVSQLVINPSQKTSQAILNMNDLQNAFLKKNPDIKSVNINILNNEQVNVSGKVILGILTLNLNLTGNMYIQDGALYYTCQQAQMNGLGVPSKIVNAILKRTNPFFKFSDIAIPTYFNDINYTNTSVYMVTRS